MDALGSGLVTLVNGLLAVLGALGNPVSLALVAIGASLAWLALVRIEELDRQGTKPTVTRH